MANSSAIKNHNDLLETIIQESMQGSKFDTGRSLNFVVLARMLGLACIMVACVTFFIKKYNFMLKNIDGVEIEVKKEEDCNECS